MKRHLALLTTVGLLAAAGLWGLRQMPASTHGETRPAAAPSRRLPALTAPLPPSLRTRLPRLWPTPLWPAPQSLPICSWTARGN